MKHSYTIQALISLHAPSDVLAAADTGLPAGLLQEIKAARHDAVCAMKALRAAEESAATERARFTEGVQRAVLEQLQGEDCWLVKQGARLGGILCSATMLCICHHPLPLCTRWLVAPAVRPAAAER